ncbi:MAG: organoarsenical effux MFS transporter ArsJ [Deltaproteobacteria bacterium]|nr:organoarsenical effux MFS transporter ArsJ [Deltaproteobacteria bacterium]MDQ3295674.1 organoarsenical effux MFS transporter ArsJ [Myxococcota bacterium]
MSGIRNYVLVTAAYWAFTLTDGALRMLVLLHFHKLGYTPVELAFLFVFYEFFGVVTNLVGGFIAARLGLRATLLGGLALQVFALLMLALLDPGWSRAASVAYVMGAQALSGIAKDLTKMSAKSAIKVLVPEGADSSLFKWVSALTGSKNALKGVGFFLGGLLLGGLGFRSSLVAMAAGISLTLALSTVSLPRDIGKAKGKAKFSQMFSKNRAVNVLSAARFFLFGARDIWFVVGVPVFLSTQFAWGFREVGGFLAAWVIGYGIIQSITPVLIKRFTGGHAPQGRSATVLAFLLALVIVGVIVGVHQGARADVLLVIGLGIFGVVFAINSAVHSYLILAYSDGDKVTMNVGFYYMANAGGRLAGTVLSGILYQHTGLLGCLAASAGFAVLAALLALMLPRANDFVIPDGVDVGGD